MSGLRRRMAATLGAVGLVLAGTACDPPPPDLVVTVNAGSEGHDAAPGDGVCEQTAGVGDCSIRAGIEEANGLAALGDPRTVVIGVPGTPQLGYPFYLPSILTPVEVTGNVRIVNNGANTFGLTLEVVTFHVAEGASLELVDLYVTSPGCDSFCPPRGEARFVVDGELILRGVRSFQGGTHVLKVNPTGVAHVVQSSIYGELFWGPDGEDGTQAVLNAGVTILDRSGVGIAGVEGSVTTVGEGVTVMRDSSIGAPPRRGLGPDFPALPAGWGDACGGTLPVSLGGNSAFDETCALTGPGDVNGPVDP